MAEGRALVVDGCSLDVNGEGEIGTGGGADGVGYFYNGDGGVVVGGGSGWAGGAEIPVEGEFGRMDHRGHGEHGGGWVRKSRGGPG